MKKLITKINTSSEFIRDAQTKREFLKHEIQKFTIDYSKTAAKIRKQQRIENKTLEQNRKLYSQIKNKLETIYDHIADGIRIKGKCVNGMSMARSLQSSF